MKELIKITKNEEGQQLVSARELHGFLEIGRDFTTWIKGRIDKYGFIENIDFTVIESFHQNGGKGGRPEHDYAITIDMAKELSMVENNEKGRQARQYFIKCEKKLKEEIKNNKQLNFTPGGNIPIEVREMFSMIPDPNKAEMMLKVMDRFYPKKEVDKIIKEKKDKPKVDLKKKAIDIFKECFDKAYYTTRGKYILFYKEPVYKCASKSGITKREFNKILLKYDMVKTERGGELPTCCIRIDNKNYRAIYLKAELLNSQE